MLAPHEGLDYCYTRVICERSDGKLVTRGGWIMCTFLRMRWCDGSGKTELQLAHGLN